jgi:predicted Zn finger-like uncharacterized protein
MSLATRCVHCNTTFKVVQDQLKVSQGWVRCGHCRQVFNALEEMFDTEQQSVWSSSMLSGDVEPPPLTEESNAFELDFPSDASHATPPIPPPAAAPSWANILAVPEPSSIEQSLPPPSKRPGRPGTRGRSPASSTPTGFIKQAEQRALWRHPAVRAVLALTAMLLLAALGLQAAHQWRDTLAARFPITEPWLHAWCDVAACSLSAPMDLHALSVDSITVVKAQSQGDDAYQLTVIVKNSSPLPLKWPLLDLTLTNSNGDVVTRRSLNAMSAQQVPVADDHNTAATRHWPVAPAVPTGATALQWQLRAPDLQLASYTAELFYP